MLSTSLLFRQLCRRRLTISSLSSNNYRSIRISPTSTFTEDVQANKVHEDGVHDFKVIYRFRYIRAARVVCRLKLYQTAITTLAVPYAGYLASVGTVTIGTFATTTLVNVLAFVMLYVMGEFFRRIVGIIYYSPKTDLTKISHLTFWGRRRDLVVPRVDIVPISDTSDSPDDIYVHLFRYSQPEFSLFLSFRFGGIVDHEKFSKIFGNIS